MRTGILVRQRADDAPHPNKRQIQLDVGDQRAFSNPIKGIGYQNTRQLGKLSVAWLLELARIGMGASLRRLGLRMPPPDPPGDEGQECQ
jgi:hypothetical protein